jgi:hypothetical protein
MQPGQPNPSTAAPNRGLPPVEPPSGRFIAQLFVVPGLIVLVVVMVLMGLFYLTSRQSPEYFLRQLDSDNADIRWRGAADLAQILKRPEAGSLRWKADAHFALEIAQRLRLSLDELYRTEKEIGEQITHREQQAKAANGTVSAAEIDAAWRKAAPLRNHVSFLASALGDLHVPAGVPLLAEMCTRAQAPDVKGNTLQRRKALWSLANLGANTRGFTKLPAEKQADILATIHDEGAGSDARAGWARTALYYLDGSGAGDSAIVRVDTVLARCAEAPDRYLREQVALAFNFWDGPLAEPTLLKLAHDDGHGTALGVVGVENGVFE